MFFSCKHKKKKNQQPEPVHTWSPPKIVPVPLACQLISWIDCILKYSIYRSAMTGTDIIT